MYGTSIDDLARGVQEVAQGFDASMLEGHDAQHVMEVAAVAERTLAHVKALAAKRVQDTYAFRRDGYKSAAHQLARTSGVTVAAARDAIETVEKLEKLPVVSAAARRGELSVPKTSAIADAATMNP